MSAVDIIREMNEPENKTARWFVIVKLIEQLASERDAAQGQLEDIAKALEKVL